MLRCVLNIVLESVSRHYLLKGIFGLPCRRVAEHIASCNIRAHTEHDVRAMSWSAANSSHVSLRVSSNRLPHHKQADLPFTTVDLVWHGVQLVPITPMLSVALHSRKITASAVVMNFLRRSKKQPNTNSEAHQVKESKLSSQVAALLSVL